jgi:adenylate kinase
VFQCQRLGIVNLSLLLGNQVCFSSLSFIFLLFLFILIRYPGTGKGTLSSLLAKKLGYTHISIGDLCREMVDRKTNLGGKLSKYLDHGDLVPDQLIIQVLELRLSKATQNEIILDGFPRTVTQAQFLSANKNITIERIFLLETPDNICIDRILHRRMDSITGTIYNLKYFPPPADQPWIVKRLIQRNSDLDSERIERRIEFFHSSIEQILSFFQNIDRIDSSKNVNDIFAEMERKMQSKPPFPSGETTTPKSQAQSYNAEKCIICMDEDASHLVLPCGHQCGCFECLSAEQKMRGKCPICLTTISGLIRVFRSGEISSGTKEPVFVPLSSPPPLQSQPSSPATPFDEYWDPVKDTSDNIQIKSGLCQYNENAANNVKVGIQIVVPDVQVRVPVDVCCVVDISGSMGNEAKYQDPNDENCVISDGFTQLDLVKHAVKTVIHSLSDDDRLSIVAFESIATSVLSLTKMTPVGKKQAVTVLETLSPEDTTNIWDGLFSGLEALRIPSLRKPKRNNVLRASGDIVYRRKAILLLTDGVPSTSPPNGEHVELQNYFDTYPNFHCQVNTFGFGYDLNSTILANIARVGNGTFSFIPDAKLLGTCFVNAASNICSNMALSCDVQLTLMNGARWDGPIPIYGGEEDNNMSNTRIVHLGPLYYGQPRDFVVPIVISNNPDLPYLDVNVSYESSDGIRIEGPSHVVSNRNETVDAKYAMVRCEAIQEISSAIENFALSIENVQRKMSHFVNRISAFEQETLDEEGNRDPRLIGLVADIGGRATKALTTMERFKRWGKHYLLALCRSHSLQIRTNFVDVGLQSYGGTLFILLQEEAGKIFITLPMNRSKTPAVYLKAPIPAVDSAPPPEPEPDNTMYYNGGCFSHSCVLFTRGSDGTALPIPISQLSKGQMVCVVNNYGIRTWATIRCVIQLNYCGRMIVFPQSGLRITPSHPIRIDGLWHYPRNCIGNTDENNSYQSDIIHEVVYNLVLDDVHVAVVNGMECCTLGHNLSGPVISHSFYGTRVVVEYLSTLPGWDEGIITVNKSLRKMYFEDEDKKETCKIPLMLKEMVKCY